MRQFLKHSFKDYFGYYLVIIIMVLIITLLMFTPSTCAGFFDLNLREYGSFLPGINPGEDGIQATTNLVARAFGIVRLLIGVIAIFIGLLGSIKMVTSRGNEEEYQKARDTFLYGVAGIAVIALSGDISQILSPYRGGLLGSDALLRERTLLFDNTVRIVITFIKYFAGAIAVAMMIRIGYRMVALSDSEDNLSEDKLNLTLITFGLAILIFGDYLIRNIFYVVDSPINASPDINVTGAMQELIGFINLMVSLVGPIVMLTFVAGGLLYAFSGINDDWRTRARRMMAVSLVGMILIYGAFAIVNTFIIGRF